MAEASADYDVLLELRDGALTAMPAEISEVVVEDPTAGCANSAGQDWAASQATLSYGVSAQDEPRPTLERLGDYLEQQQSERFGGRGELNVEIVDDPARASRVDLMVDGVGFGAYYEVGQGYGIQANGPCRE